MALHSDQNDPRYAPRRTASAAGWVAAALVLAGIVWAVTALWDRNPREKLAVNNDPTTTVVTEDAIEETTPTTGFGLSSSSEPTDPFYDPSAVAPGAGGTTTAPGLAGANEPVLITDETDFTEQGPALVGKQVMLSGTIKEVHGGRGFIVDLGSVPGVDDIYVLDRAAQSDVIRLGEPVSVTGTVSVFNLQVLEQDLGTDLNDADFVSWDGKQIVVADSVAPYVQN